MKKSGIFLAIALFAVSGGCNDKSGTVASIGRSKISVKAVQERIMDAPPAYQGYLTTDAGRKQFLDLLVRERIVLEAAKKAGIKKRAEYRKSVADFKKEQARKLKEYKESLIMELYVRELYDKELNTAEKEVEGYYEQHKAEFTRPLEIVAQHILVPTRQEAETVLKRLKAGENFGKIAREVSTDPISAARGGEIGPFRRGDLVPEFEKAVFPLKVGEVSEIAETQFGFHVIKKTSQKVLQPRSLDEAKYEIKKMLEKNKFDAWLEKSKNSLHVKVSYDMLSKLPPPPQMQPAPTAGPLRSRQGSEK